MATAAERHAAKIEAMRRDFLATEAAYTACVVFGEDTLTAALRYGVSERVLRAMLGECVEPRIPPHLIGPDGEVRLGTPYSIEEHE